MNAITRLGGSPRNGGTGYPWHDGELLYAADLNAAFNGPLNLFAPSSVVDPATSGGNPVVPGYTFSARYGANAAVDIFGMVLNVPPRNTFNVIEGVLTLPPSVTSINTYHAAVSGFSLNQSATSVGFAVGAYCVAAADNCQTGAFGSASCDSPHTTGIYTGVRLQNEYDWYLGNATSSVRGTLHDGYFKVPPNSGQNTAGYIVNIFDGSTVIANASFSGSVMTVNSVTSGTFAVGYRIQATGVDGTANIVITSFGTGTGGAGTYNIGNTNGTAVDVGTIASTFVRGSASFLWNTAFQAPDGTCVVAFDVGQRNYASTLTVGSKSQLMQWRYSDQTVANERIMQQWVDPTANGGVLRLRNFNIGAPASYGVENWNTARSAFMGRNAAHTGWIDALHVEANDRVVVGYGSNAITELCTSQGVQVEILDGGEPSTNSIGMRASTATTTAHIYMVGGGNLQFSNTPPLPSATTGFVSPWPVVNGVPTGTPQKFDGSAAADISNAFTVYNTQSKTLNIYDPLAHGWYHVTLTPGAA